MLKNKLIKALVWPADMTWPVLKKRRKSSGNRHYSNVSRGGIREGIKMINKYPASSNPNGHTKNARETGPQRKPLKRFGGQLDLKKEGVSMAGVSTKELPFSELKKLLSEYEIASFP